MNRWLRLALALYYPLLIVAQHYGWDGKWLIIPTIAAGVCSIILITDDRRLRKSDELTTLNLSGR